MMGAGLIPLILIATLPSGYTDVEARHGASHELRGFVLEISQARASGGVPEKDDFLNSQQDMTIKFADPEVGEALNQAVMGHLVVTETGATSENGVLSFGLACAPDTCEKSRWKIQSIDTAP